MIIRPYIRRWSVWRLGWFSHLGSGLAMGFVLWGGRIFRQGRTLQRFVVSVRPGWVRNYFAYFFVYSARCVRACARARTVPGTPVGRMPVRSQVFERRLPPGPVAI